MNNLNGIKTILQVILLFLAITAGSVFAQDNINLKSMLVEAESYYIYEEYKEALPIYLKINKIDPENDNVTFKIGICYLNDPFHKDKAIPFLQKATNNMKSGYREGSVRERQAPPETVYYLAKAYLANDQPEKAIWYFEQFADNLDETIFDKDLVLHELASCKRAGEARLRKVYYTATPAGGDINSRFSETNPVISGNGQIMAFSRKLQFYDAIFYVTKKNGQWSSPINIIPDLKVDGEIYPVSLNYDGTELYLYRSDEYNGNLYVSRLNGSVWGEPVKLNGNINTPYWESHASVSRDGRTLYFSSNRPGGLGELDIYLSRRTEGDNWGPAENLGAKINSRYNDDTPFLTEDGSLLFFSSLGHTTIGGYDIFFAEPDGQGGFKTPQNLGYPINTSDNELFFQPNNMGRNGYFAMARPEGKGLYDIYYLDIYYAKNPRKFEITGNLGQNLIARQNLKVGIYNKTTGETVTLTNPDIVDGTLNLELNQGNYEITFSGPTTKTETVMLNLPVDRKASDASFRVDLTEKPEDSYALNLKPEKSNLLKLPFHSLTVNTLDPVTLVINAAKDATIQVTETFPDGSTKTSKVQSSNRPLKYTFTPQAGTNKLQFELTGKNGQTQTEILTITAIPLTEEPISANTDTLSHTPEGLAEIIATLKAIAGSKMDSALSLALSNPIVSDANTLRSFITDSLEGKIPTKEFDSVYVQFLQGITNRYILNDLVLAGNQPPTSETDLFSPARGILSNLPPDADWEMVAKLIVSKIQAEINRSTEYPLWLQKVLNAEDFELISVSTDAFTFFDAQKFTDKIAVLLGDNNKTNFTRMTSILEKLYLADIMQQLQRLNNAEITTTLSSIDINEALTCRLLTEKLYRLFVENHRDLSVLTKAIQNLKSPSYPATATPEKWYSDPLVRGGGILLLSMLVILILFVRKKRKKDNV